MKHHLSGFLQQRNWQQAFECIKNYDGDDEALFLKKSLLCRINNQFELEKELIEHALTRYPDSLYMQERMQWHNLPWFKRMSPRVTLHFPRDQHYIPKTQTMEKLCIVTAANDKYFEFIVECIESIKATRYYKDIDIKILDVGLTKQQYFLDRWNIKPIAPGWPVECETINFFKNYLQPPYNVQVDAGIDKGDYVAVPCEMIQYAQAVLVEPFLHEYFPDYDYFLWIDADCWVQDERGLDRLVYLAERQGHAFPGTYIPETSNPNHGTCRVPTEWYPYFEDKPTSASSIFCTSKNFQALWAKNYREAGTKCGYWWGQEEEVASYSMKKKAEIIDFTEVLYLYRQLGLPVVKVGETALRNPETLEVIPVFGLGLEKQRYFYPVAQYHHASLDHRDHLNCVKAAGLDIDWSISTPDLFSDQKLVSFRFRSIPGCEYKKLEDLLSSSSKLTAAQELDIALRDAQHIVKTKDVEISELKAVLQKMTLSTKGFNNETHTLSVETQESQNLGAASKYKTLEFIALREAQYIVKEREAHIEKLDSALREAQCIVKEREAHIQRLDIALRAAQNIVWEREPRMLALEKAISENQAIIKEKDAQILALNKSMNTFLQVKKILNQVQSYRKFLVVKRVITKFIRRYRKG